MIWQPFDHILWKQYKLLPNEVNKKILVGVSGGADSVALLLGLKKIQPQLQYSLNAIYIHHGEDSQSPSQNQFRQKCEDFCRELCFQNQIEFMVSEKPARILKSEEEFRQFRYEQFRRVQAGQLLSLAHHIDDLLETRLMRLIRGTGLEGLMAMESWQPEGLIWRPLLQVSKQQILDYLKAEGQSFMDDPSNADSKYFRNWVRNEWLPELEKRNPGALKGFARSLETIANEVDIQKQISEVNEKIIIDLQRSAVSLERSYYLSLSQPQQKQFIAQMLKKAEIRHFSQGQIIEIKKQLDITQSVHSFKLSVSVWTIDAEQISVQCLKKT